MRLLLAILCEALAVMIGLLGATGVLALLVEIADRKRKAKKDAVTMEEYS